MLMPIVFVPFPMGFVAITPLLCLGFLWIILFSDKNQLIFGIFIFKEQPLSQAAFQLTRRFVMLIPVVPLSFPIGSAAVSESCSQPIFVSFILTKQMNQPFNKDFSV